MESVRSRRNFIASTLGIVGVSAVSTLATPSNGEAHPNSNSIINVKDAPYNAIGNAGEAEIAGGTAVDDTDAIQNALDDASEKGGGRVFVPSGNYLITNLTVPAHVILVGELDIPTAHSSFRGSTIVTIAGRGDPEGTPLITLGGHNSTIRGFTIYYPDQNEPQNIAQYPWSIRGGTSDSSIYDNLTVQDVLLVNSFRGIDFGTFQVGRHLIQRVYGQPLHTGILIDKCLDCGRIEDVHFWPFWSVDAIKHYMKDTAVALIIKRSDWQIVNNIFAFGYHVGLMLSQGYKEGGCNGQFTNLNFDMADVGIDIYHISRYGIFMSNVNIVCHSAYGQGNRKAIWQHSNSTGDGPLSIQNGSFWGDFSEVVLWERGGLLQISSSVFRDWTKGDAAIRILKGRATIQGNYFQDIVGKSVYIGSGCDRIMVTGNNLVGNPVENQGNPELTLVDNNL